MGIRACKANNLLRWTLASGLSNTPARWTSLPHSHPRRGTTLYDRHLCSQVHMTDMTPLKGSHPVRWTTVFQPPFKNGHSYQMYKSIWKVDISVRCTILFDRHPCKMDTSVRFTTHRLICMIDTPLPEAQNLYGKHPRNVHTFARCKYSVSVWQKPFKGGHSCQVYNSI